MVARKQEFEVVFEEEQMRRLVARDKYLKFVYDDMVRKGRSEADALLIIFNSNVIGDSVIAKLF